MCVCVCVLGGCISVWRMLQWSILQSTSNRGDLAAVKPHARPCDSPQFSPKQSKFVSVCVWLNCGVECVNARGVSVRRVSSLCHNGLSLYAGSRRLFRLLERHASYIIQCFPCSECVTALTVQSVKRAGSNVLKDMWNKDNRIMSDTKLHKNLQCNFDKMEFYLFLWSIFWGFWPWFFFYLLLKKI